MMPMRYALLLPDEAYVEKRTLVVEHLRDHMRRGREVAQLRWVGWLLSSGTTFPSSEWSMWIPLSALSFGRRACISVWL